MSEQVFPHHDGTKPTGRWWWLAGGAAWLLVVVIYASRTDVHAPPYTWGVSLRASLALWTVWAALAPLIILIDRHLPVRRDRVGLRLLIHLPLSLVVTLAQTWLTYGSSLLLQAPFDAALLAGGPLATLGRLLFRSNLLVYWAIAGAYVALAFQHRAKERQLKVAELERLLAESRFDTLRTRLHPHVLFNALNAISAHVESDPRTARYILEQFASLLRLSLEHEREPEIPLERELAFVACYLDLQKVRFEDRFEVITKVEPEVLGAFVPTFILQPLVENALRHGVLTRSSPGQIAIQAWRENGSLRLSVRDDGPGLPAGWDPARAAGEGLSNTRERLHQLYGDDHSLDIAGGAGHGVHVDLTLPLREGIDPVFTKS